MFFKNYKYAILTSMILILMIISGIAFLNIPNKNFEENQIDVDSSSTIEGFENIKVTEIIRNINISSYGLVNIDDRLTILNQNSNPITSILVGIPLENSDNLIYIKSQGTRGNSLIADRNYLIMDNYEIITIYFNTPLLPQQSTLIRVVKTFDNLLDYSLENLEQKINFTGIIFPILPYKAEGTIRTAVRLSSGANALSYDQPFGMGTPLAGVILYDLINSLELNYLDPFLENMGNEKKISVIIEDNTRTEMQLESVKRDISISPWGIIKVQEEHVIQNTGKIDVFSYTIKVPEDAKNIIIFDDIGELTGASIGNVIGNYKDITINLVNNRAAINPDSKFKYILQYHLSFENYVSVNWIQESMRLDLATTKYEYLGIEQEIRVVIEGCGNIEYISTPPDAIESDSDSKILIYQSEKVSPLESKETLVTFSIDYYDLMLRPIILFLLISGILSLFVFFVKSRVRYEGYTDFKSELIPINEIREFCSLYEEKNALVLENRKAEEEAKRKKMTKKSYKNLLTKNNSKIEQIKEEILPFKKVLMQSGENFQNIVNKLDVLDAERISVNDSINLLDNRYKRGKLPSRQSYQKLADDFYKRRKKIDRTIDKYLQQLRSYLL